MRVRRSLQELVSLYDAGDRTQLENLVRAFRKIQSLPPNDPDSFFVIAGYHGEPFVKEGPTNPDWWCGYCQHQTVLFPTWHRAYLYRLENALRNASPEALDLALPFWDECATHGTDENPIPWFVTARQLPLPVDGKTDNPLFSYTLQKDLADNHSTPDVSRYTKPAGYQTYLDHTTNTKILNSNVKPGWTARSKSRPMATLTPTFPIHTRSILGFRSASRRQTTPSSPTRRPWPSILSKNGGQPHYGVALEEPHNAIHLALGGFYEKGNYNADPILGANGDMGENETAAFDPIFYLHHAFIDYIFWQWQLRHDCTATGSLTVEAGKDGTISLGDPTFPKGTALDTNSPLDPFTKPGGGFYTSEDVIDINKLGYSYGRGSLDNDPARFEPPTEPIAKIARVHNVSRADYAGSFVIRTHVELPIGEKVEVGREAVLSRWNVAGCRNCQDHLNENSFIAIDNKTMEVLKGNTDDEAKINFHVQIQSREFGGDKFHAPVREPVVEFL
ncbi:tyrosinase [Fusarium mexicanum]|uniref:tyrosinase n=1 Tax=Fusarium mexicanum TaxID=751941 RepID=A0A8H5MTE4_9HYPO|nr:tyrosinase [Fusarium mexicanum]